MTMIENKHFNCIKMVSCKVMTTENNDDSKLEGRGCWAILGVTGGVRVYWGPGRDSRYSGARWV